MPPAPIPGTINVGGGVPTKWRDQAIGAVAVSSALGDASIACVNTVLAKVADKLK
ncbi:MAG: hypothetical protein AB7F79_00005 [Steroidobacteraceae bacterium]